MIKRFTKTFLFFFLIGFSGLVNARMAWGTFALEAFTNAADPADADVLGGTPVNFAMSSEVVFENVGSITVTLNLDSPLVGNGKVVLKATKGTNLTNSDFTTTPALTSNDSLILNLSNGATSASFNINVVDDNVDEGNEMLTFSIARVEGNLSIGPQSSYLLTILDNDPTLPPKSVNFATSSQSVNEDTGSIAVTLNLSGGPLSGNGKIFLRAFRGKGLNDSDFTTTPPLSTGDTLVLYLNNGATSTSFNIGIIDDTLGEKNETLTFTIARIEGDMMAGTNSSFTLTIIDNDSLNVGLQTILVSERPIRIYPNPVTDQLVLELPPGIHYANVQLFDIAGKLCDSFYYEEGQKQSVSSLSKGIYLLRIMNGTETFFGKLIKE